MTDEEDARSRPAGQLDPAGDRSERARPDGGHRPPRPAPPSPRPDSDGALTEPSDERSAPSGQDDGEVLPPGPAPIRPWNQERAPRPSDPDAARRATPNSTAGSSLPPSYEPDPAVYEVTTDGDGEQRRRRFGRRRRDDDAGADPLPSAAPVPELPGASPPEAAVHSAPPQVTPVGTSRFATEPVGSSAPASYEPPPALDEPEPEPWTAPPDPADTPWTATSEPPAEVVPASRPSRRRRGRPKDTVPVAEPPTFEPPVYEPPTYEEPAYEQPAHEPPAYEPPPVIEPPVIEPPVVAASRDVEAPPVMEPPTVEPAFGGPVEPGSAEPGLVTKATRWLFEREAEPAAVAVPEVTPDVAPEAVDITDAPALDLELADEFHGELEAPTSGAPDPDTTEPVADPEVADSPAEIPPATSARHARRARRGWRRRIAAKPADDDEGPFFPPEPADVSTTAPVDEPPAPPTDPTPSLVLPSVASVLDDVSLPAASEVPAVPVPSNRPRPRPAAAVDPPAPPPSDTPPPTSEQLSPSRQRPRPRPAAARAAASPAAETSTEPDPAGPPAAPSATADHLGEAEAIAPEPTEPEPTEPESAEPESAVAPQATDPEPEPDEESGRRSPDIERYLSTPESPHDQEPAPKEPKRRRRRIRNTRWLRVVTKLLIVVVVAVVAAVVLRAYVVAPYYIPSASMEPALHGGSGTNDRILVDKITYRIHDPHQGDIVVFDRPDTWQVPDRTLVKRIVGLPGDIVSLRSGLVYVNGMRLTENYINPACGAAATKPLTGTSRWTVPMGDYFVMGDNRCDSEDSRAFGPIPGSKIVGRAFLIVWPLSRFGTP